MRQILMGVALAGVPVLVSAQTIPALSADGLVGVTWGPSQVGNHSYNATSFATRLAAAVRLGSKGAVRPILMLDYSSMPHMPYGDDLTIPSPGAPTHGDLPQFSGFSAGVGVRAAISRHFTVGSTVGVGRYQDFYTTAGGRRTAFRIDAEVAAGLGRHVGLVVNLRHVQMPDALNDKVWFRPLTFGLRVQ